VSVSLEKTLITPFFWPTNMRPSDANCTTTGFVSPLSATVSRNPLGSTEATAARSGPANEPTTATASTTSDASAATTNRRVVSERTNSTANPPPERRSIVRGLPTALPTELGVIRYSVRGTTVGLNRSYLLLAITVGTVGGWHS